MFSILSGVLSLIQYICIMKKEPEVCDLECCLHCGKSGVWRHGYYFRKADRSNNRNESKSLNPIPVQRFYCSSCRKTSSVLPECIPPRRWYLWEVQQLALLLILSGKSFCAAAKEVMPSRQTITRWVARFKDQFCLHKDTLCNYLSDLGRTTGFGDFWQSLFLFKEIPLSTAMSLCHFAGVTIP